MSLPSSWGLCSTCRDSPGSGDQDSSPAGNEPQLHWKFGLSRAVVHQDEVQVLVFTWLRMKSCISLGFASNQTLPEHGAANNLSLSAGCVPGSESYIAEGIVVICKLFSCINSFW